MKILIVNDDSITAPGIETLARAAGEFGDVYVAAPAEQCSAMSQKLTLRELLTVERVVDFPAPVKAAWKIGGTPVDCVKVALDYLLEEKPDWVLSGINNGYNAGFDIAYSGTLGAAFEAARNQIPAIALSIAHENHLSAAQDDVAAVLRELLEQKPEPGMVWNVNFPSRKEGAPKGILRDRTVAPTSMFRESYIEVTQPDGTIALACQGRATPTELFPAGSDARAVREGYISIGQVRCFDENCKLQPEKAHGCL